MSEYLDRIGQQMGDYRLVNWLGSGGFGHIYLAEQVVDRKRVVVKLLPDRLSQSDDWKLFLNEARTIRLQHPHIVPILDFGISRDDYPYLVMEYAEGGTLRALFPRGMQVPLQIVKGYIQQVASALQYAHDRRLIHRDVKPENMLLRRDGVVLLSDFGMVITAHRTHSRTEGQNIGGTMPYMAPEQIQGQPCIASDQYSLGVVLYEWLAGRRPFEGTPQEIAVNHVMTLPPSLLTLSPMLSPMVDEVVRTALAKDPNHRFASIQAFSTALEHASVDTVANQPFVSSPGQQFWTQSPLSSDSSAQQPTPYAPMVPPTPMQQPSQPMLAQQFSQPMPVQPQIFLPPVPVGNNPLQQQVFQQQQVVQTPRPTDPWSHSGVPTVISSGPPPRPDRGISKRYIVFSVIMALVVAAAAVGVYAVASSYVQQKNTESANATATAIRNFQLATQVPLTATATVKNKETDSIAQYNDNVLKNGTMYGIDAQRTHYNPYEYILRGNTGARLNWTKTIATQTEAAIMTPPVVDGKYLYVGDQKGIVYAFDVTTGEQVWQQATGDACIKDQQVVKELAFCISTPAVVRGLIYVCSENRLFIFDAASGSQKWASPTDVKIMCTSPTVTADGIVYFRYRAANDSDKVYALDGATLSVKWSSAAIPTSEQLTTDPVVGNKLVYVGSASGKLYAFDATMTGSQPVGALKWSVTAGNTIPTFSSPVVTQKMVYITSDDQKLYAFDALAGTQQWVTPALGGDMADPAVNDKFVYMYVGSPAGSQTANLYAFDLLTGTQKWVAPTGALSGAAIPEIAGELVYLTPVDEMLHVFDALSGKKVWTSSSIGAFPTDPTVANGKVYVGSTGGKLFVFSLPEKQTS